MFAGVTHPFIITMDNLAFALVAISAVTHAYWNYLVKTSMRKHIFVALSKLCEVFIFSIPAFYFLQATSFEWEMVVLVSVAAIITFFNYYFLSSAYHYGELSLTYPISRSGTLFIPFIAFVFIGETIDSIGWIAVLIILVGTAVMHLESFSAGAIAAIVKNLMNKGSAFALLAAFTLACYTVWGKKSIEVMAPFSYFYLYTLLTTLVYSWFSFKGLPVEDISEEWRLNKIKIVQVGFFNGFTFLLVLFSLSMAKATYVGGLRQLSVVVGVFFGYRFLNEKISKPKIAGVIVSLLGGALLYLAK